jgi:hypothetical protein
MRLIAVMIPLLFVINSSWAQHDKQEEIETHADRKRGQDYGWVLEKYEQALFLNCGSDLGSNGSRGLFPFNG